MSLLQGRQVSFALLLGILAAGCGDGSASEAETSADGVLASLGAAVSDCADQRDACENAAIASVDCQTTFRACKTAAVDKAVPGLAAGARACAETARTCRKGAKDDAAKDACHEQQAACVAEHSGSKADAHASAGHAPVKACTDALHACMDTDEDAKVCTDRLRACLTDALPNRAGGKDGKDPQVQGGATHKPDNAGKKDGGSDDHAQRDTAQACSDVRKACVEAGHPAKACAEAVKSCHQAP